MNCLFDKFTTIQKLFKFSLPSKVFKENSAATSTWYRVTFSKCVWNQNVFTQISMYESLIFSIRIYYYETKLTWVFFIGYLCGYIHFRLVWEILGLTYHKSAGGRQSTSVTNRRLSCKLLLCLRRRFIYVYLFIFIY